ncbi:septum formation protein Maf [Phytophthora nicotianae CJ01A1]|uniref:Septum formation protein Maf n=1 Tax=Phytophthora nicotianae CJ01A1 TaxID=1317063 RepID=W2WZC0_PHYNI|nr:septum formation protein Maf [Phytophthora nicotianae CJ01A1]
MLSALPNRLRSRRVILASQSPRRLELLRDCGLTFEVIPSTFEENLPKERFRTPDLYVIENAKQKALEVLNRVSRDKDDKLPTVVIGCDTVVVQDGVILEKPKDEEDAFNMLAKLSDRPHEVFSGVALFTAERGVDNPHLFFEKTSLVFGPLEPEDIRAYIATGEPMDKAGSYGLQGRARCFVQEVHGCTNNVIGFPVQRFCKELKVLASRNEL